MIWNLSILLLGGALHLAGAQQTITVPLEVAGTRYEVSFPPGSAANAVAREFCIRNAAAFGITTEDQVPGCVGPVAEYLVNALAPRTAEEPAVIRVPLDIGGKHYSVDYRAGSNLVEVAREFCVRNAVDFDITVNEQIPNCAGPVAQFLESHGAAPAPPTILNIPLTVAGKEYTVQFAPSGVVSLEDTAKIFCVQNAASLGITTNEQLPGCISPVTDYLRSAVNPRRTEQPKMISATLNIANTPYEISYPAGLSLESVAQEFCIRNAGAFGITKDEQLPNCIRPVAEYLHNAANPAQKTAPQMLTVPITIGETKYEMTFPAGSAANAVAQEFCVRNAATIGITTNEELPNCVGPVSDYLINQFA